MSVFKGAGVAIVTPMYDDGTVNFDKLAELIEFNISNGSDAIIVCGTTGEAKTLNDTEHKEVVKFTVDTVNKRVPVIARTGSNDTSYSIQMSKYAQNVGADALLLVTPYYNKTSQKGLYLHFKAIADSVDIPCILYNVPSRTGINIEIETYKKLATIKNIVAVKEASGNISQIAQVFEQCDLDVYSGNDDQIVPIMSLGGIGVISVLSNIAPKQTHDICEYMLNGNYKKAAELQLAYLDLIGSLFCEVNPIPVKTALNLMGMDVGPLRLPLCEMSEVNLSRLEKSLKKVNLI